MKLAKFVGWGGLSGAFINPRTGDYGPGLREVGRQLKEALTPEEHATAERSTQYAHYTAEHVIRAMWGAVQRMGFKGGKVFEPGMGIGHFKGMAPPELQGPIKYQGVEMDALTAKIAKALYPKSDVRQADFTQHRLPENDADLAIGNPPFGDITIRSDAKYAARKFRLHDYFFAKSLDGVRPGGLMAFVTSAGTMNKVGDAARRYMAERAEFVGGVRLPDTAFAQNAGTHVTTDVLFFKKRPEKVDLTSNPEGTEWTQTVKKTFADPNRYGRTKDEYVNRYFAEHPEQVLGEEGLHDRLQAGRYGVKGRYGQDLASELEAALSRLPKDVMEERREPTRNENILRDLDHGQTKERSFYVKDGKVMQVTDGVGVETKLAKDDAEKVRGLVEVRDHLQDVIRANIEGDAKAGDAARAKMGKAYDAFTKKHGAINKVERSFRPPNIIELERSRAKMREDVRAWHGQWMEGDFDAERMAPKDATLKQIAELRQAARERARGEGLPFDEGSFVPSEQPDIMSERRPNLRAFGPDPESHRLSSIEDYDPETGVGKKRAMFYENPLTRDLPVDIRGPEDGVLWSYRTFGRFDAEQIAKKMDLPLDKLIEQLGDKVYHDPHAQRWEASGDYLSGDVVTKLEQARVAARREPDLERNVKALEAVQPAPVAPVEVDMQLGRPWIPADVVKDFLSKHLRFGDMEAAYANALGGWQTNLTRRGPEYHTWGVDFTSKSQGQARKPEEVIAQALKRAPDRVTYKIKTAEGERTVVDENATEALKEKVERLREEFETFVRDPEREQRLTDLYNAKFNREVLPVHDGSWLATPGIAADKQLRPHQKRVVARIIQAGNTYMAHAVGAGKTMAMIAAAMELRRLGLARKPMFVVPNHMLGQFTKEFYEAYPAARIMVADDHAFDAKRRKQFVADAAMQDLDAIIIKHSSFGQIGTTEETQRAVIERELNMAREAMESAKADSAQSFTVKDLNKSIERLEQRLQGNMGKGRKDDTVNFEEMGVDHLFVDEAHLFRKLSYSTAMGSLKGLSPQGSDRALDLYTKIAHLESKNPGRSVVLASGTPVTNTMGELYSLSRYMQPHELEARGLEAFDAWAATFGDVVSGIEMRPDGSFKEQTRFSRFASLPELYKMVGKIMDVVTGEQLGDLVVRPKLKRIPHYVDLTPEQEAYQGEIRRRLKETEGKRTEKGGDGILKIYGDGLRAAIDMRLIHPDAPNEASKLNEMIENVHRIWERSKDTQFYDPKDGYQTPLHRGPGTQMIFSSTGINPSGEKRGVDFTTYRWIKKELMERGVPASEIAFIKDHKKNPTATQKLFNDMNSGRVRIMIGSTEAMGVGTNAQRQLVALHNTDPEWYPANDEQKLGRIVRQGNLNPEVEVHDYAANGGLDSIMFSTMGRKAKGIEGFFRGDPDVRDMDDFGEGDLFELMAAATQSDPRIKQLADLKQERDRLRRRQAAHSREQYGLTQRMRDVESNIGWAQKYADQAKENLAQRVPTRGDAFKAQIAGQEITKRPDAAKALEAEYEAVFPGVGAENRAKLASLGGFDLVVRKLSGGAPQFELKTAGDVYEKLGNQGDSGKSLIQKAENLIHGFEEKQTYAEGRISEGHEALKALHAARGKKFEHDDHLASLEGRTKGLEATLKAEALVADQKNRAERDAAQDVQDVPKLGGREDFGDLDEEGWDEEGGGGGRYDVSSEEPAPRDLRRDLPPDVAEAQARLDRNSRTMSSGVNPRDFLDLVTVTKHAGARVIDKVLGHGIAKGAKTMGDLYEKLMPDPVKEAFEDTGNEIGMALDPMSQGTDRSMAQAQDVANAMRAADAQWHAVDQYIDKTFDRAAQERMWEAADEEGVLREQGKTPGPGEGLNRLNPEERKVVEDLHGEAQKRWAHAYRLGLTRTKEARKFWTPRMLVEETAAGVKRVNNRSAKARGAGAMTGEMTSDHGSFRQRKHEYVFQTEAAAQKLFKSQNVKVVKNIRTMGLALRDIDRAIAGKTLIEQIRQTGREIGKQLVHTGANPDEGAFFTMPHERAFYEWVPKAFTRDEQTGPLPEPLRPLKDEKGEIIFEKRPIYVPREYEGPLKALLQGNAGWAEKGYAAFKSRTQGMIMLSPLMHMQVIAGKVLPTDAAGLLLPGRNAKGQLRPGRRYLEGNAIKNDPVLSKRAHMAGYNPLVNGARQDVLGIADPSFKPGGHSMIAHGGGFLLGLANKRAGEAFKEGFGKAMDFKDQTLLWDRLNDLGYGLWKKISDQEVRNGLDIKTADQIGAHYANLYIGSLPREAMSKFARVASNLLLFSRSFNLTNIGVYRSITRGLPASRQAQIVRDAGRSARLGGLSGRAADEHAQSQLRQAQGATRRRAIGLVMADVIALHVMAAVGRAVALSIMGFFDEDKAAKLRAETEHPEPGKEFRVPVGEEKDGTVIYARPVAGHSPEDLLNWLGEPITTLKSKESGLAKWWNEVMANDIGYGGHRRKLFDDTRHDFASHMLNGGKIAGRFLQDNLPVSELAALGDWGTGNGDPWVNAAKFVGPLLGFSISHGARGGPKAGAINQAADQHSFDTDQRYSDIAAAIRKGDMVGANKIMDALRMSNSERRALIRGVEAPGTSKGHAARAIRHADPAQRQRILDAAGVPAH